jgi:hypothetical protein
MVTNLLRLFILFISFGSFAQSHDSIISQCLTLPKLVDKEISITNLPKYQIMDHGVQFDITHNMTLNGKEVEFIGKKDLPENYFIFRILEIDGDIANIEYRYITKDQKYIIKNRFIKTDDQWHINKSTITEKNNP